MKKKLLVILSLVFIVLLAGCTETKYLLTFNIQEDTMYFEMECTEGETITFPNDPNIDHFTFEGWFTSADYLVEIQDNQTCTSDMTIYGKLVSATHSDTTTAYTLKFVDYDGTVLQMQEYDEGTSLTSITLPSTPTRSGYTFSEWSITVPNIMPANDVTIQAQYTQNAQNTTTYTLQFVDYDGTVLQTGIFEEGDMLTSVTLPSTPTRNGYTFNGWSITVPSAMPANDVTIQAQYDQILTQTITYVDVDHVTVETFNLEVGANTNSIVAPALPVKDGVKVLTWESLPDIMPQEDITISPIYYTLEVFTKELDNFNSHEGSVFVYGDYIVYMTNNTNFSLPENEKIPSTVDVLKISDPNYHRVIDIDTANGYHYNITMKDSMIIVSSPKKDDGIIHFYDVLDESYHQSLTPTVAGIERLGHMLVVSHDENTLIASADVVDSYDDVEVYIDISTSTPQFIDTPANNLGPNVYGGISYEDYYVLTSIGDTDVTISVYKYSDSSYQKDFSLNTVLSQYGLQSITDIVYYQRIEHGVYTNPITYESVKVYYSVDLTVEDPTITIYQASDFSTNSNAVIRDLRAYKVNGYTILGAYVGEETLVPVIKVIDCSGNEVETINQGLAGETLLNVTPIGNVVVITTKTNDYIRVSVFDISDPANIILLDTVETNNPQAEDPMYDCDRTKFLLLVPGGSGVETFVYIDVENLVQGE